MRFLKPFVTCVLATLLVSSILGIVPSARADSPVVPVALVPIQRDTPIALVALTLDADISESNGRTLVAGYSTFKLHNTDPLNDLQVPVGFPAWAGDSYVFDPARLGSFAVTVDGKKLPALNPGKADLKIGSAVRSVDWYTFTLTIAGDEKKTVRYDFQQDLGDAPMPRFIYGMLPATSWKGSIGSARLSLNFPNATTLEQIVAYDPPNPEFDGEAITWRFTEKEAAANPSLTLVRPSIWNDWQTKRRAAQASSNDANARAALGNVLRLLALQDSPKRDSYYGQAVAELETAIRLDSNNRTARQALAALYESRAGAASGPRQPAYVQLAVAQWEALAGNDTNARKQLAEDYFYLALDAQTLYDFTNAQMYFDKASALAPNGAGPLFTLDRAAAQKRALNVAWARASLDKGDAATAAQKARAALGDAVMTLYKPPMFYVAQTQVVTASKSRTMRFTLSPRLVAETQNAVSGFVTALQNAGVDVGVTTDNANLTLAITLGFESDAELAIKLDGLAKTIPSQPEWALVRAVLSPSEVTWSEGDELFAVATQYREGVDLAQACVEFDAQINAAAKTLAPLANASVSDGEAQLKRALFKYAQDGWQAALANAGATYRGGNADTWVDACAAQTVIATASTMRIERVVIVALIIQVIIITLVVVLWGRRPKRQVETRRIS